MKTIKLNNNDLKRWEKNCTKVRRSWWLRKRRLNQFQIKPEDKILDLGCGDGLDIKILRQRGIVNVVGVDLSQKLLRQAKKNNPEGEFVLASAEKLPFKNNQFDIVLADSVLYLLIHLPQSFYEISRVLKPGGKICFINAHFSWWRKLYDWITFMSVGRFFGFLKRRQQAFLAEKKQIEYWNKNEDQLLIFLHKTGFRKIFLRQDLLSQIGMFEKVE